MSSSPLNRIKILSLYKRLLRLHSNQPEPFRSLSNSYLKSEFKSIRSRNAEREGAVTKRQWEAFYDEWQRYEGQLLIESQRRQQMEQQQDATASESPAEEYINWNDLNAEQRQKLMELQQMLSAQGSEKPNNGEQN